MRLEICSISRQFGLEHALQRVSLELRAGARHTILGSAGAGKSTLAGILGGLIRPTEGELRLDGHRYAPRSLREARAAGVAVLPQEPLLPLALTVEEALMLGFETAARGGLGVQRRFRREAAERALASLRCDDIPLTLPLHRLPENQRRRVALTRTLMGQPRLVVLDEPPPLPEYDTRMLLLRLRELATAGSAILLLTRSAALAKALGGTISLLQKGQLEAPLSALPPRFVPEEEQGLPTRRLRPRLGPVVLSAHHAMNADLHTPVNLTIREGEIVGLAGEFGAGRRALLRMLAGLEPMITGELHLDGRAITRLSATRRQRLGLAFFSGDDDREALFPDLPISTNLLLPRLGRAAKAGQRPLGRWGIFPPDEVSIAALDWMEKLHIRPGHPSTPAGTLSRANRHRLLLGRLFQSRPRVLLLFDPTRHLSANLQTFLYGWLSELAAEGRAVVLAGPPARDLLAFCDSVGALCRGRFIEPRSPAEWSEKTLEAAITPPDLFTQAPPPDAPSAS